MEGTINRYVSSPFAVAFHFISLFMLFCLYFFVLSVRYFYSFAFFAVSDAIVPALSCYSAVNIIASYKITYRNCYSSWCGER